MTQSTDNLRMIRRSSRGRWLVPGLLVSVLAVPHSAYSAVVYRVNAGGPTLAAADESLPDWAGDTSAARSPFSNHAGTGNTTATSAVAVDVGPRIPVAVPAGLSQSERWDDAGSAEMQWDFPMEPGDVALVRLYFAEIWTGISAPGQRLFSMS